MGSLWDRSALATRWTTHSPEARQEAVAMIQATYNGGLSPKEASTEPERFHCKATCVLWDGLNEDGGIGG